MFGAPTDQAIQRGRERWLRTRSKGKWPFILFEGVLFIVPIGLLYNFVSDFAFPYLRGHKPDPLDFKLIPVNVLIWLAAGYIHGLRKWNKGEEFVASTSDPQSSPSV